MLSPEDLEAKLRTAFNDAEIELEDLTGTQDHYALHIASDAFEGVGALGRHRLVYAALEQHMKGDVHALSLRAYTKSEWAKRT